MKSIGIVGQGFVGTAVREGTKHALNIVTYDKKDPLLIKTFTRESVKFHQLQKEAILIQDNNKQYPLQKLQCAHHHF